MATDIQDRLLRVDSEIHAILHELHMQATGRLSVDEVAARMEKDIVSDEDSTEILQAMRGRATKHSRPTGCN